MVVSWPSPLKRTRKRGLATLCTTRLKNVARPFRSLHFHYNYIFAYYKHMRLSSCSTSLAYNTPGNQFSIQNCVAPVAAYCRPVKGLAPRLIAISSSILHGPPTVSHVQYRSNAVKSIVKNIGTWTVFVNSTGTGSRQWRYWNRIVNLWVCSTEDLLEVSVYT